MMDPQHVTTTTDWPICQYNDIILQSASIRGTLQASATIPAGWALLLDISMGDTDETYIRTISCWKRCAANEPLPTWTDIVGDILIINQQTRYCVEEGSPLIDGAIDDILTDFYAHMIREAPKNRLYVEKLYVLLFDKLIRS